MAELLKRRRLMWSADTPFPNNLALAITYTVLVKGDQDIKLPEGAVEATQLYPEVEYKTIEQYLQRFL